MPSRSQRTALGSQVNIEDSVADAFRTMRGVELRQLLDIGADGSSSLVSAESGVGVSDPAGTLMSNHSSTALLPRARTRRRLLTASDATPSSTRPHRPGPSVPGSGAAGEVADDNPGARRSGPDDSSRPTALVAADGDDSSREALGSLRISAGQADEDVGTAEDGTFMDDPIGLANRVRGLTESAFRTAVGLLLREAFLRGQRSVGQRDHTAWERPVTLGSGVTPAGLARRALLIRLRAIFEWYRPPARAGGRSAAGQYHVRLDREGRKIRAGEGDAQVRSRAAASAASQLLMLEWRDSSRRVAEERSERKELLQLLRGGQTPAEARGSPLLQLRDRRGRRGSLVGAGVGLGSPLGETASSFVWEGVQSSRPVDDSEGPEAVGGRAWRAQASNRARASKMMQGGGGGEAATLGSPTAPVPTNRLQPESSSRARARRGSDISFEGLEDALEAAASSTAATAAASSVAANVKVSIQTPGVEADLAAHAAVAHLSSRRRASLAMADVRQVIGGSIGPRAVAPTHPVSGAAPSPRGDEASAVVSSSSSSRPDSRARSSRAGPAAAGVTWGGAADGLGGVSSSERAPLGLTDHAFEITAAAALASARPVLPGAGDDADLSSPYASSSNNNNSNMIFGRPASTGVVGFAPLMTPLPGRPRLSRGSARPGTAEAAPAGPPPPPEPATLSTSVSQGEGTADGPASVPPAESSSSAVSSGVVSSAGAVESGVALPGGATRRAVVPALALKKAGSRGPLPGAGSQSARATIVTVQVLPPGTTHSSTTTMTTVLAPGTRGAEAALMQELSSVTHSPKRMLHVLERSVPLRRLMRREERGQGLAQAGVAVVAQTASDGGPWTARSASASASASSRGAGAGLTFTAMARRHLDGPVKPMASTQFEGLLRSTAPGNDYASSRSSLAAQDVAFRRAMRMLAGSMEV